MSEEYLRRKLRTLSKKYSMEIISTLFRGDKKYVSQLSKELYMPYATVQQRVNELENMGLVKCFKTLDLTSRRPIKEVELINFQIILSPRTISQMVTSEQSNDSFKIGVGRRKEEAREPT